MNCTACGYENRPSALLCGMCGAKFVPAIPSEETPPTDERAADATDWAMIAEAQELERREADRLRRKAIRTGYVGIGVFFAIRTLFGFPLSFHPLYLVPNLVGSFVVGFPVGWAIYRRGGSRLDGAILSGAALAGLTFLLAIPSALRNEAHGIVWSLIGSFVGGAIPGYYIAAHVELDQ